MKAFHNDTKIKAKYVKRVVAHQKADRIIQGDMKSCAVGCTLDGNYNHKAYETELGIPEWLARLEDTLFEGMSKKDALVWPAKFLKAIKPGQDLGKVKTPFIIYLMEENLKSIDACKYDSDKFPQVKAVIEQSKEAVKLMIEVHKSGDPSAARSAAWSAASSAAWSAESAARSAAWSAESAEWSAESAASSAARSAKSAARSAAWSAAYKKHANKLLMLIKEYK